MYQTLLMNLYKLPTKKTAYKYLYAANTHFIENYFAMAVANGLTLSKIH